MTWILPRQLHTLACALDTEALSLDSNEQSQVCAQSLFVRSKPSQLRIWSAKWKRDSWTRHLSGRILRPSLGNRFATEWTSSLGATHASPSVQQASDSEVKTPGISGRISQEAFQFFNQESASLKTSRATLPVGCITFCATWEDWVTEQRGAYSARLNAERHTNASGCSSWPSPVASEVRQGFQDRSRGMKGSQESLTTVVVKTWATPSAREWKGHTITEAFPKGFNLTLSNQVHGPAVPASSSTDGSRPESLATKDGNWTTPVATDTGRTTQYQQGGKALSMQAQNLATPRAEMDSGAHNGIPDTLHSQMKAWATPQSRDGKGAEGRMIRDGKSTDLPSQTEVEQTGLWNRNNGKLNPRWVETLMGLPVGWTMPSCASPVTIERMNSDSSVTVLSQQQRSELSEA